MSPYRTYISKVKKVWEEAGPAAERGSRIHDLAEKYVKGELKEMPSELKKFAPQFEKLHKLFSEGKVEVEGEWGFTLDWETTAFLLPFMYSAAAAFAPINSSTVSISASIVHDSPLLSVKYLLPLHPPHSSFT